ncbi:inter-alpha-trypsin inhibitor heavy chain H3-like isoform X2 [Branchiostoma floridae]|uniref:Inter-alpha-trypsin inhibitor heavy chain H3-like isoform X2 n=1 Tax=Branchiostoma floridae TaxID=7739 RepID=A0A9J7L3V6_BRAFL|nr:inter-alpha-trypsin inhibitor heavy chain H3-like isoform X2 [Branchiostoma floridae]
MEYMWKTSFVSATLFVLALLAADVARGEGDFIIVKRFHKKRVPRQAVGGPVAQQIGSQWGSGFGSGSGGVPLPGGVAATVSTLPLPTTPPPIVTPPEQKKPEIYALDIKSTVTSRYAKTVVTSRLANKADEAREAVFEISLPKTAFISNFSMTIDNVTYFGEVKEKEKAEKEYKKAVSKGQSAGKVSATPKRENKFKVSVNVAAQSKVTFNLTYEELLQRRLGSYELVLSIRPQQVVRHLKIDVRIIETRDIVMLDVPNIRRSITDNTYGSGELEGVEIARPSPNRAHIQYRPTDMEQMRMSPSGISGDFLVRYDVKRDLSVGDIQIVNGYFVHYFAPSGLPVVPKNIVFIIDKSGSMGGTKMRQTKQAMNTILKDLRDHDRFNVMPFSYSSTMWRPNEMVLATRENIESARTYVRRSINAGGGTNINQAIIDAADLLRRVTDDQPNSPRSASLIIFLTDGLPSVGESKPRNIMVNVKNAIREQVSLFCLGFGKDVDFPFLEKMALENRGLARRIYEDSDAALQLKGFYDEVATPLLFDVQMRYPENLVTDLTPVDFNTYFDGSELVVAGRLSNEVGRTLDVSVVGNTVDSQLTLEKEVNVTAPHKALLNRQAVGDFTQRLWAYLTIKHYLKQRLIATPEEKTNLTAKALELSLKYNFVTPLTSMIVVKPEEKEVAEEEKEADGAADVPGGSASGSGGRGRPSSFGQTYSGSPVRQARPRPQPKYQPSPSRSRGGGGGGGGGHSVDGDPHFIVDMPGLNATLCFDINGEAGDVLNLLRDHGLGTVVNARVVAAKRIPDGKQKLPTYFGELSIVVGSTRIYITPYKIVLQGRDPTHDLVIPWGKRSKLIRGPVDIDVRRRRMSIRHVGSGVEFMVLQHPVRADHPIKPDYLGFYVQNGKGLSKDVHGLIGQFHYGTATLHVDDEPLEGGVKKARIYIKDRKVEVHEKERRNHLINRRVQCWLAPNNADQLIDGNWRDYLVPEMFTINNSQLADSAIL